MVSLSIIGSVARETDDQFSDKDLLAVGQSDVFEDVVQSYVRDGWNVARFSKIEFEEMASANSLFIQHAIQDGRIVRDDFGYFGRVFNAFRLKGSYLGQLSEATEPISLVSEPANSYWGLLFQADVLYVAVRNACILHKASCSNPTFDFRKLIDWIAVEAELRTGEKSALLELRALKVAYRNRTADRDTSAVERSIETAKKLAEHWRDAASMERCERRPGNGYFDLRVLEGRLVGSVNPAYLDNLDQRHALSEMWTVICNPSIYKKPRLECLPEWSVSVSEFLSHHRAGKQLGENAFSTGVGQMGSCT